MQLALPRLGAIPRRGTRNLSLDNLQSRGQKRPRSYETGLASQLRVQKADMRIDLQPALNAITAVFEQLATKFELALPTIDGEPTLEEIKPWLDYKWKALSQEDKKWVITEAFQLPMPAARAKAKAKAKAKAILRRPAAEAAPAAPDAAAAAPVPAPAAPPLDAAPAPAAKRSRTTGPDTAASTADDDGPQAAGPGPLTHARWARGRAAAQE